jgi:hypothetical protein
MVSIPVIPIKLSAVNRCALSAQTLPLKITLSKFDTCASRARSAAALNRLTFSCGVSPGGPDVRRGNAFAGGKGGSLADAWGVVDVNRVASVADRGIVAVITQKDDGRSSGVVGLSFGAHQEIFRDP